MTADSVINPKIAGKLIFCFRKIRSVPLIELRNGFSKVPNPEVLFHTRVLGRKIYANEVQWKRWERTQKIAEHYAYFEIFFSLETESEIIKNLDNKYDYLLITHSSDLVNDYKQAFLEFQNHSRFSAFCKIRKLDDILEIYKTHFKLREIGSIAA